ncbi:hypothetical protein SEA_PRINGAR_5 [Mycobacterium phage Pringar]|uniref:Uncharacterized protein n=1 Tax=Mycobacterium phage Pringar TaxID=2652895 RepID=A0A5P8DES2_9CAUD|nr:hypothetical protein SEA_PRINGAR_5 [Mycobacterium phage Pringar]
MPSDPIGRWADEWDKDDEDMFRWIESVVKRITYKPGWGLDVERAPHRVGTRLTIAFTAIDSRVPPPNLPSWELAGVDLDSGMPVYLSPYGGRIDRPIRTVPISGDFNLPHRSMKRGDEERLLSSIRYFLREVEFHELQEWFRLDGELVSDPHKGHYLPRGKTSE